MTPVGYLALSEQGVIIDANLAAATLLGLARSDLIQQPLSRFLASAKDSVRFGKQKTPEESSAPRVCRLRMLKADCTSFLACVEVSAVHDANGAHLCEVALIRDLSIPRTQWEDVIDRFFAIVGEANIGLACIGQDGQIVRANQRLSEFLGYSKDELLAKRTYELTHPDDVSIDKGPKARLLHEDARPYNVDKRLVRRDGSLVWARITWLRLPLKEPDSVCLATILQDISESKRIATELDEARSIRREIERSAATGYIAARIAHELNNPLGGIINSFRLVKSAVPADHEHWEFVEIIEQELHRIADIVREMYHIYRPHPAGTGHLQTKLAVHEILKILAHDLQQNRLGIDCHINVPESIAGIPHNSVVQVLYNLIKNAIEVSPHGGRITITADIVPAGMEIAVRDEGPGIPIDLQEKIFQPINDRTPKNAGKGLGLGLWISKGIAEGLSGTLAFETAIEQGTVFRLTLPYTT